MSTEQSIPVTYILSYVNEPNNRTTHLDRPFTNLYKVFRFVRANHPNFTSYQVIVTRD